jgi:hypothetical protein
MGIGLAHDPAKCKRFADKIMRHFKTLAREPQVSLRNLRKLDCDAKPVPTFADRALAHVPEKWEPVFRMEHAQN